MNLSSNDKWAVLSPGRTGSKVIVDCIRNSYESEGITLSYVSPHDKADVSQPGLIVHSHKCYLYSSLKEADFNIVVNTRDLVDTTISWCIQKHIGHWHLYSSEEYYGVKIVPFELDMNTFYKYYDISLLFYRDIAPDLSVYNPKLKIIDYNEFENDSDAVFELLDLPYQSDSYSKPIKNPGSPKAWISNWDEIQTELYRLKRIPEIL